MCRPPAASRCAVSTAASISIGWTAVTDVDVIVLDIDGGAMLRTCIDSIKRQSVTPHRIIVFDNGSRTPVTLHDAEVLRSEENRGFAGGVNVAFRHVDAPFVALVNND